MTVTKLGLEPKSRSLEQNGDEGSALRFPMTKAKVPGRLLRASLFVWGVSLARKFVMRIEFGSKGWQGPGEVWNVSFCANHMQNLIFWRISTFS